MSWAHPLDENGRRIPAVGRSAATMAALPARREMHPAAHTRVVLATVFLATMAALGIAEGTTAAFTAANAARLESR
ncbi:hypothetical protein V8J36_05435 [Frigidibacter sp. MR17.14]|uniref:hypothetical protein n=1 Tax=Frigidibacter sp. MR17.14 TaxID=3126509 RepID=UPI003012F4B8